MTSDEEALLDGLVQTAFAVIAVLGGVAARHDLSLTMFRVGAILRDRELTMSELAGHLGLDRSTITGLIDRATRRGIVVRVSNTEDRRSTRVTLTRAGQELAVVCAREVADEMAPLTTRLKPADRRRLAALLETLADVR